MITQKAVIDLIGFDVDGRGRIEVRFAKLRYSDGELVSREPHRLALEAGDPIDANLDNVAANLAQMGFPLDDDEGVKTLKATAEQRWTKDRVDAVTARRAAEQAEVDERNAAVLAAEQRAREDATAARNAEIAEAVQAALAAERASE